MSEMDWLDIFVDGLRYFMDQKRMTPAQLASESGLDKSTIIRYLNKERAPSAKAVANIAYALDCETDDLINVDDYII